ncbi:MAG: cyclic pyranopterin monophosphate synthase MoaC [Candidatus Limnocylindrales bacterium]|jgi:cyclic pyranopterin phosphate synthase
MADISEGPVMPHRAVAEAEVAMAQETLSAIVDGAIPKGDVLSVAELAGVMAGKRAADLIPLVHPAGLTALVVNASPDRARSAIRIRSETAAVGQAGVEMEALTVAAVAALTVYDMVRDIDPGAFVRSLRLVSSSGGESDEWRRPNEPIEAMRPPKGVRVAGRIVHTPRAQNFRPAPRKRTP